MLLCVKQTIFFQKQNPYLKSNPTHHLQMKFWNTPSFLQSTQSWNTFTLYELFHNNQHLCWNIRTPHINYGANFQKFIILFFEKFAFISYRNFKRTHDFQQGLQPETSKNEKIGRPKQLKNHPSLLPKKTFIGWMKLWFPKLFVTIFSLG